MKAAIITYCEGYGWMPQVTHNGKIVYKGEYKPTYFEASAMAEAIIDRIEVEA